MDLGEAGLTEGSRAARMLALAQETVRIAGDYIRRTGGRVRFNLQDISLGEALVRVSDSFDSFTSNELRLILRDPYLRQNTRFYSQSGVDVTETVLEVGHELGYF